VDTDSILAQIRGMGYVVKIFKINGTVEMHAVHLKCEWVPQIARCNDGDGPNEEYHAACLLAEAVGIDLRDGYRPTRAFPHRLDYAVVFPVTVLSILDQEVVAVDLE